MADELDPAVLGDEIITAAAALRRLVRRRLRPNLSGPPLRGAQVEVLRVVERHPGIGVAPVARILHLAPNSVSTLVNQLIDKGLVLRETDPDDRRAARLNLTEAAQRRLGAWRDARAMLVGDGIATLSPEDRLALAEAVSALQSLVAVLADGEDP